MIAKWRTLLWIVSLLLLFSIWTHGYAQVKKLYPVDEATKDPSLFVFRARLLKAIQMKDATFLHSILDKDIMNSFGGAGGIAEFKQTWHAERPQSKIWSELLNALALGGGFDEKHVFSAPYVFSNFPEDLDAYKFGAVIDDAVRVRREPNLRSEIILTLSFDVVKVLDWTAKRNPVDKREWITVEVSGNRKGYVVSEYLRSPIDYRAIFEKKDGKWLMTAFIAGD
jgi:hypothetical protein